MLPKWMFRPRALLAFGIFSAAIMLQPVLRTGFYLGDDVYHVTSALAPNWHDLRDRNTSAYPAAKLTMRIEYAVFSKALNLPAHLNGEEDIPKIQQWAPWIRVINAAIHIAAAIVLFCFLQRIGLPAGLAMLIGAIWVAHPCACESVSWVSERKNVLTALFGFSALLAWPRGKSGELRLWLSYACYFLALMSKPSALGFLPVLAALEMLNADFLPLSWKTPERWSCLVRRMIVPVALCAGSLVFALSSQSNEIVDPPGGSAFTAILTDSDIFLRYILNTILPVNLSWFYGVNPIVSPLDARLWLCIAGIGAVFAFSICFAETELRPLALFGAAWFFGALGPNSNIISSALWMQDRYHYLAMPGLLLALLIGVRGVFIRWKISPAMSSTVAGLYLALIVLLLAVRAPAYADLERLQLENAESQPYSAQARIALGTHFKSLMEVYAPEGAAPNPVEFANLAHAAAAQFEAAIACPDCVNFECPFDVKLRSAIVLLQCGDIAAVRKTLEGWLPPPHLKMLKMARAGGTDAITTRAVFKGYLPRALESAWAIMAECSLREAIQPDLPLEKRREHFQRATEEAEKAKAAWPYGGHAAVVMGKILLFSSKYERTANPDLAQTQFMQGMEILKSIPPNNPHAKTAQYWLEHPPAGPSRLKSLPENSER